MSGAVKKKMNRFLKWLDNYWYHYKWRTIVCAFFIVLTIVCVVQCTRVEHYDYTVFYAGPRQMEEGDRRRLGDLLAKRLDKDVNGDGKKTVEVRSFYILSDEQYEEKRAEALAAGNDLYYTASMRNSAISDLTITLGDGGCLIVLMDPFLFETYASKNVFLSLSSVLGEDLPASAVNEYALSLADLPYFSFYRDNNTEYSDLLASFPADTMLCMISPTAIRSSVPQDEYRAALEYFRRLVNYSLS